MSENNQTINWFPGHMAKTRRMMEENIKLVDVVVEIVDARVPFSSKNPYLDKLWSRRPRVIVMSKTDLADEQVTKEWTKWFEEQGFAVVALDILKGKGLAAISRAANQLCQEKIERAKAKGLKPQPIRMMITGIPNVGKSTLINQMAHRSDAAKTGNKPGVTKAKQWIRLSDGTLLLDTPGILWPKFDDQTTAMKLAFIGSIKDDILNSYTLCAKLCETVAARYPDLMADRYHIEKEVLSLSGDHILEAIGKKRGHLKAGGVIDVERTAVMVLDEFRNGKIGRISLERPEDKEKNRGIQ
ncbi:MAG: ribosome biogenesis GTPase YlqF [Firmicutes bacterium]|nr:ribosome biogenesis GTPase YlqF [Bacillota bacterium]